MKNLILLLFIAFSLTTSFYYPQRQEIKFVKRIFDLNKKNEKAQFDNWVTINLSNNSFDSIGKQYESKKVLKVSNKVSYPCFYEDERFEVYRKCNGEFGGALFFKSKRTRKLHVLCAATDSPASGKTDTPHP